MDGVVDARCSFAGALAERVAHGTKLDAGATDRTARIGAGHAAAGAIVEHEPPLYVVGGYKNDREFFDEVVGENARNAYRNVRVAKFASPAEETKFGISKLDAALGYIEAKLGAPLEHPPLPVAFDRLRIGKNRMLLENVRREDVEAATRELSKTAKKATSSDERAAVAAFAKHPALKGVRVRVRGGMVSFTGVPAASMGAFRKALGGVDWGRDLARLNRHRPWGTVNEFPVGKKAIAVRRATKRSIRAARLTAEERTFLSEKAEYEGVSYHKRSPGDFGLTPPAAPRPDKTLCDEANVTNRALASALLASAIEGGLASEGMGAPGFPKQLWAVDESGQVFEAMYGGSKAGLYHGYPIRRSDPFFQEVRLAWERRDG